MLWTDCAAVVSRLTRVLEGSVPTVNWAHGDLWIDIASLAAELGLANIAVTKVAAHRAMTELTPLEEWCFWHNSFADRAAVRANFARPKEFWELRSEHASACGAAAVITSTVHDVQIQISRVVVQLDWSAEPAPAQEVPLPSAPEAQAWRGLCPLVVPQQAVRWYGFDLVNIILQWFWQTLSGRDGGDLVWVAHQHLYLDFQFATGHPGPVHIDRWKDGSTVPFLDLMNIPFRRRTRWFMKVLKECLRHAGQPFVCQYGIPQSQVLFFHTGTVALPWPSKRLQCIDDWILACLPGGVRRTGAGLDVLPLASKHPSFATVSC